MAATSLDASGLSASDPLIEDARRTLLAELLRQADDVAAPAELRDLAEALAALASIS